ncbi:MAG TPA: hypothetical protein VFU29_13765 [Chitinophagaceae bacterium]|nr:hypothetical protein [Chitinophagaceae bacterium]
MRSTYALLLIIFTLNLFSCKKEHVSSNKPSTIPPDVPIKHVLLKDITIPRLPSPYYHFEYNSDSLVTKADFASGFTIYDVFYSGNKIREMRNNILVNHDTLRYVYDNTGKLALIKFINDANVIYRHASFIYNGAQIKEIEWDRKDGNAGFIIDRTLTFTLYPDSNVKTITDHRPSLNGAAEYNSIMTFEQYDDKINVDDFGLIHDGIHDHLFLLQGFRLQKGNPKKERLSVNGVDLYTNDYTYTYNSDNTPSTKIGDFLYISGPSAGQRFQTNSIYTYY